MLKKRLFEVRFTLAISLIILFVPDLLEAFTSGSPFFAFGWHGRITDEALSEVGFSEKVIMQLKRGNRHQDWDVTPVRIMDTKRHFGRNANQTHEDAFARNKAYLEKERARIIALLSEPTPRYKKARKILGWCIHTTQDAFSHSNYWLMSAEDKKQFLVAITHPGEVPPEGTLFVCSGRDSRDSLSYGHVDHHKDGRNSPEGEEAFWIAYDGAVEATREFCRITYDLLSRELEDTRAEEVWKILIGAE